MYQHQDEPVVFSQRRSMKLFAISPIRRVVVQAKRERTFYFDEVTSALFLSNEVRKIPSFLSLVEVSNTIHLSGYLKPLLKQSLYDLTFASHESKDLAADDLGLVLESRDEGFSKTLLRLHRMTPVLLLKDSANFSLNPFAFPGIVYSILRKPCSLLTLKDLFALARIVNSVSLIDGVTLILLYLLSLHGIRHPISLKRLFSFLALYSFKLRGVIHSLLDTPVPITKGQVFLCTSKGAVSTEPSKLKLLRVFATNFASSVDFRTIALFKQFAKLILPRAGSTKLEFEQRSPLMGGKTSKLGPKISGVLRWIRRRAAESVHETSSGKAVNDSVTRYIDYRCRIGVATPSTSYAK